MSKREDHICAFKKQESVPVECSVVDASRFFYCGGKEGEPIRESVGLLGPDPSSEVF